MPADSIAGSKCSRGSRNVYRAIASHTQEDLFGASQGKAESEREVAITGKDTVTVRRKGGSAGNAKSRVQDVAVINASDLHAIQNRASNLSKGQALEEAKRREEEMREREEKSRARRVKMQEMEILRKKNQMKGEFDKEAEQKANGVKQRAKDKLDEAKDEVKEMNQMMLYSKVVTVRDAQIMEKRMIQAEKAAEEKRLDDLMEQERLKTIKLYEERDRARQEGQRKGAQVIIEQIKQRQVVRMKEEEARDQERLFVMKQIESNKADEQRVQEEKEEAAKKLMAEVAIANDASMKIKDGKMVAEKLENMRILKYQEEKQAREAALEAEKQAEQARKIAETERLRTMQEKASDKVAEMDALRAKRANEAAERAARKKEACEKKKVDERNAELVHARRLQQQEKERRLAEQAKFERDEFERIIEVQMQQEESEKVKQDANHAIRMTHCEELKQQIAAREEKALQDRRNALEEGNIVRSDLAAEKRKLDSIKNRKIKELQKQGVPEKYWSELAKKKYNGDK